MEQNWAQIIIRWFPFVLLSGVLVFFLFRDRAGKRKDDQPQAKVMNRRATTIRLIVPYVLLLSFFIFLLFAFPWTWTFDHIRVAAMCVVLSVPPIFWGCVWWFGGPAVVKKQWADMIDVTASVPKFSWKGILFWAVVAVALVFLFNMFQPTVS